MQNHLIIFLKLIILDKRLHNYYLRYSETPELDTNFDSIQRVRTVRPNQIEFLTLLSFLKIFDNSIRPNRTSYLPVLTILKQERLLTRVRFGRTVSWKILKFEILLSDLFRIKLRKLHCRTFGYIVQDINCILFIIIDFTDTLFIWLFVIFIFT